ncbi:MAG: hypothetical protein KGI41_00985 [Patescibacteria group bacterium]|nr:hypothetical protein [Patescibacteria group bacterium]
MKAYVVAGLVAAVIIGGAAGYLLVRANPPAAGGTATSTDAGAPVAGAGEHCGGFIRNAPVCAAGFHCELAALRPDTGGTCVADTATSTTGVSGTVLLGPTCPVERFPPDPACAPKPYPSTVRVYRAGLTDAFAFTMSADGTYSFPLPPGTYTLTATGGNPYPRCTEASVEVPESGYVTANISCDSGIR